MKVFKSASAAETADIAERLAAELGVGSVVALVGGLGAGKTAFVKGIARYFNCRADVTSPTYTLVNQYDGDMTVYHFDVYRLENPDIDSCDWIDEYLFGDGVCVIEWADNIKAVLPEDTIRVEITKNPEMGEDFREIKIC